MSKIYLVSQHLGSGLLSLLLVDELHQDTLVLEHITLGLQVQLVVQVTVNLLSLPVIIRLLEKIPTSHLPVSLEEPPEDPHPLDPELLLVGPGVGCSLPLTEPTVTTFSPGLVVGSHAGPGVDSHGLLDHQTVLDQLPDVGAGVGVGDLVDLVGVQPHLRIKQ